MSSDAVVVVPTHKSEPNEDELIALRRAVEVLSAHPIHLVVPALLDTSLYASEFPSVIVTRVPERFFGSVARHNRLLLSPLFYELFAEHRFLLIHHLDAFVFRDELQRWCDEEYDYVGPPWFEGFDKAARDAPLVGVGNGGFSLRKISSFLHITRLLEAAEVKNRVSRLPLNARLVLRRTLLPAARLVRVPRPTYERMFAAICSNFAGAEDIFWGLRVPADLPWFRVIDAHDAIGFAFENHPDRLYEMAGEKLPFGCHAWERYDRGFWQPFIDAPSSPTGT